MIYRSTRLFITALFYSIDFAYFHPTSVGVFSGKFSNFTDNPVNDVFTSLSFGFGKEVIKELLFGFGVNLHLFNFNVGSRSSNVDDFVWGLTGDVSVVYRPGVDFSSNFFVFRNLILGIGIKNAGLIPQRRIIIDGKEQKVSLQQMDLFRVGFGFDFIRFDFPDEIGDWSSRLLIDIALIFSPLKENINLGWKNSFNFKELVLRQFYFSMGYFHNRNLNSDLPFTLGLGLNFFFDKIEFDVNYALVLDNNPRDLLHKIGVDLRFGELDDTAPDIDTSSFSEKGIIEEGTITD